MIKHYSYPAGVILLAIGVAFGAIQNRYYGYVDAYGVLHDSLFLPLGVIAQVLGGALLFIGLLMTVVDAFRARAANPTAAATDFCRQLAQDYSDTAHGSTLVLGDCSPAVQEIIGRYTSDYRIVDGSAGGRARVVRLNTSYQVLPDIVRALSQQNIAVYQLITDDAGGGPTRPSSTNRGRTHA